MTSDLMRGMWAQTHRERPRDDGRRDWDGEATTQARWSLQRREWAGRPLPWGPWEGARPCDTLGMGSWPQS